MHRALHDLQTALQRAAALAAVLGCLLGVVSLPAQWGNFPGPRIAAVLAAHLAVSAWAARQAFVAPDDRRPLRVFGALSVLTLCVQPAVLGPAPGVTTYSPLMHVLVIGAIACAISFGPRAGVLAGAVAATSTYLIRAQQMGGTQPAWEGFLTAVTCLAGVAVVILIARASRAIGRAADELWDLQAVAAAGRQREHERGRMDALVHDAVLGALLLAGRGQDDRAAGRLAEEAISVLEAGGRLGSGSATDWAAGVARTAERLGLDLELDARGHVADRMLADALTTATNEALVNIARHSGQTRARVTARFTPRLLAVSVTDPGRGFDPQACSIGRAGIATSIRARMRAVGGEAAIVSGADTGTEVSMRVRPKAIKVEPATWSYADFAPMVVLAFVAIACHSAIAVDYLNRTHLSWISALGPFAIALILAWTWWTPPRRASWLAACATSIGVAAVLTANVVDPDIADWRLWFVGAFDGIIATIAFRFSGRMALATALAIPTAMAASVLACGAVLNPIAITISSNQLVVCAILGALLRRGLGQASMTLHRVARRSFELRVEETARAAREEEVRARIDQLGEACLPMLHRLAERDVLDGADREACLRIEAGIRDQLVARPLLDDRLVRAIERARLRGVRVEVAVDARVPQADAARLRELMLEILPRTPAGALLRATWQGPLPGAAHPAGGEPAGVLARVVILSMDDDGDGSSLDEVCRRLAWPDVLVDADEDILIVELVDTVIDPGPFRDGVITPATGPGHGRLRRQEQVAPLCPSF